MTIAIAMKINDGIILATDSASTILGQNENGYPEVHHTYFTADKLFNLQKGNPIGAITWGNGSIDNESISTLVKDFRKKSDNVSYSSVESISKEFVKFLEPKLTNEVQLGFVIAGYSVDKNHPEMFLININEGTIEKPIRINEDDPLAISWFGETSFLSRFLLGIDPNITEVLRNNNLSEDLVNKILLDCNEFLQLPLGVPAMPIQDAIDLVSFLAEISVKGSRFVPGPQIIGGDIDIAVITKHEGFKWINRKHYYKQNLNLTTGGD